MAGAFYKRVVYRLMGSYFMLSSVLFLFATPEVCSQTLHCIIVADTKDRAIGAGCEKDLADMASRMDSVAHQLGYRFHLVPRAGSDFNKAGLERAIDEVQCTGNDVLVFYYSGHGFSTPSRNSHFPLLYLRTDSTDLVAVHQRLKAKKPRLCITLGDCCNNVLSDLRTLFPKPLQLAAKGLDTRKETEILRRLFAETKGDILIATAKRGEKATSTTSYGSFYTYALLTTLRYAEAYNNTISWESLLKESESRLQELLNAFPPSVRHHSHWQINSTQAVENELEPAAQPAVTFDQLNAFLNELADESKPFAERNELRRKMAPAYFAPESGVKIYIKNPEKPVDIQPIATFLNRLIINARRIARVNIVERLSELTVDGHYRILTVDEVPVGDTH